MPAAANRQLQRQIVKRYEDSIERLGNLTTVRSRAKCIVVPVGVGEPPKYKMLSYNHVCRAVYNIVAKYRTLTV